MVWNISTYILPTRMVLNSRFKMEDTKCLFCGAEEETTAHLIINCTLAHIVWANSSWPINFSTMARTTTDEWVA